MKCLAIIIFCLISVTISGQETDSEFDGQKWEAPYTLPVPKGWAIERFRMPIGFAPQIQYKGIEDIRFTPGWAKRNSDEYMEQKPIVLNCKVHLKSCPGENRTFIFYELSPRPLSHNIWLSLDKLWYDFKCKRK